MSLRALCRFVVPVIFLSLAVLFLPLQAAAQSGEPLPVFRESPVPSSGLRRIGHWIVTEHDVEGILPACSITAAHRNGYSMTLSGETVRDWSITLRRASWRRGAFLDDMAHYWVDTESPLRTRAEASRDGFAITFQVRGDRWLNASMRNGNQLSVSIGTSVYRFSLERFGRALDWLARCVPEADASPQRPNVLSSASAPEEPEDDAGKLRDGTGAASWLRMIVQNDDPPAFTSKQNRSSTPVFPPKPDRGGKAMNLVLKLVEAAGFEDAEINAAFSARRWGIGTQATWTSGENFGAVRHYHSMTEDLYHIERRSLLYHETKLCGRGLESGIVPPQLLGVMGTYTRCPERSSDEVRLHLRVETPSGDTFMVLIGGPVTAGVTWPIRSEAIAMAARTFAVNSGALPSS